MSDYSGAVALGPQRSVGRYYRALYLDALREADAERALADELMAALNTPIDHPDRPAIWAKAAARYRKAREQ